MRLLVSVLLSFLALSSVSADGTGKFNSAAAAKQANTDRQNTIAITSTQGVAIQSRSLTYTAAVNGSMPITSYDEVDIVTGIFPDDKRTGKVEIQIDNLNVTQTGMGKKSNLQVQEFAFAFRPYSIVQYVETNAVANGFDVNDTLCNEYQVRPGLTTASQFVFKAVSVNVTQAANATAGTTTITNFEGISADKVLKIVLHAPGAVGTNTAANMAKSVWINGRFVSPTSIKFDVVIDVNQPGFKLNTSAACTNYSIAIKSWTRSMQDIWAHTTTQTTVNGTTTTTTTTTNLDRIQTGGNANPFGFFTWATTATVTTLNSTTTATSQVLATSLLKVDNKEDHDNLGITKEAVHSFIAIRPGVIAWDPEFGSDSANPDIADAVSNSTSAPTDAPSGATTAPPSGNTTNAPTTPAGKNIASTTSFSIVSIMAVVMVALFGQ